MGKHETTVEFNNRIDEIVKNSDNNRILNSIKTDGMDIVVLEESQKITNILNYLRYLRDKHPYGKIRSLYNEVCDRLDVLESKLIEEGKNGLHT